jgi:hypothetical protein
MKCIEKIEDLFISIENKEIKTNFVSRIIENNIDLKKEIFDKSSELDLKYKSPTDLQRLWYIFKEKEIKMCKCGDPLSWRNYIKGYNKTCGNKKCSIEKNVESVKKHYTEKYGVDHLFKTEKFKKDLRNKFKEKYGVDNPFRSEEIKKKIRNTNIEKFGESSWLKVETNRKKLSEKISRNKMIERDLKIKSLKIPIEVKEYESEKKVIILCKICNEKSQFSISYFNKKISAGKNPCLGCNPILRGESKGEMELYNHIKSLYTGEIIKNDRITLNGKEIDVYVPDLGVAFEFNGIYYHSELFIDKNKVLDKKNSLSKMGISLINIWEDEWDLKGEIIKSRISSIFGLNEKIYARKCQIKEISGKEERDFLLKNHIQGYVPSKIKMALIQNGEIVCLMTFGGYRKSLGKNSIEGEYELLRFCNRLNTSTIGGASKLFKEFIKRYNPEKVISYQNNSWNTGNLYSNLEFEKIGITPSNYHWAKGNVRFNRFNFRKDKLIKQGYDPNKTEWEIMEERGYYRIWDLGNIKWEYTKNPRQV